MRFFLGASVVREARVTTRLKCARGQMNGPTSALPSGRERARTLDECFHRRPAGGAQFFFMPWRDRFREQKFGGAVQRGPQGESQLGVIFRRSAQALGQALLHEGEVGP